MEALPLAFTTGWASGINAYTSPEHLTNIAASSAEDMAVAGVVSLAAFHPTAAMITAAVLLVTGLTSVYFAIRAIRRGLARRARRERRSAPAAGTSVA
jgi:hypothetical protein